MDAFSLRSEPTDYDVVIAGAGIIGCLTAYILKNEAPDLRVTIIDKSMAGGGASQFSLGMIYPYGADEPKRALARESQDLWSKLIERHPDLPLRNLPFFAMTETGSEPEFIEKFIDPNIAICDQASIDTIRVALPWLTVTPQNQLWVDNSEAWQADPRAVALFICRYLRTELKVPIWEGIKLESDFEDAGMIRLSDGRKISYGKLALCLGPWAPEFLGTSLSKQLKIRTKKIVSLLLDYPTSVMDPMIFMPDKGAFLVPNTDLGQWQLSFTSKFYDIPPDINRLYLDEEDELLASNLLNYFGINWETKFRGGRVFCDTYGENGLPVVRKIPDRENMVIIGAGSGIGFRLAPAIASAGAFELLQE